MNNIQKEEFRLLVEFKRICEKHDLKYSLGYGTLLGAIRHQGFIPWDDDIDVIMHRVDYDKFINIVKSELPSDMIYVDHEQESKYYFGFGKIRSKVLNYPEKSTNYLGINQGVWIDIFPFDAVGDNDLSETMKQRKDIKRIHNFFVMSVFAHPTDKDKGITLAVKSLLYKFNKLTKNMTSLRNHMNRKLIRLATCKNSDTAILHNCLVMNFTENEINGGNLTVEQLHNCIIQDFEGEQFSIVADYENHLTGIYGDYMTMPPIEERISNHSMEE